MVDNKRVWQVGLATLAVILATLIGLGLVALKKLSNFYYTEMAED